MSRTERRLASAALVAGVLWFVAGLGGFAQDQLPPPTPVIPLGRIPRPSPSPAPVASPSYGNGAGLTFALAGAQPLPINLPTALKLGNARGLDIALASQRLQLAAAQLSAARVLWLPSVYLGTDYYRHDGQIQDVQGNVFGTSKSGLIPFGIGPSAVFSFNDAVFVPLAARQTLRARQAQVQAAANDTLLNVTEAYFNVQQARGELGGALDAVRRAEDLLRRVQGLAPALVPALEITRARTDLARRKQLVSVAQNNWRASSAELMRVLHLDPALVVQPLEPAQLQISLVGLDKPLPELLAVALTNRPELAAQQALVQATLVELRRARWQPLVPSLLVRGFSTPVTGTLAAGPFGGGLNSSLSNFSFRQDWDVQVLWQLQNLGFGNRAIIRQRGADSRAAQVEFLRVQDRVASEVVQALALAQTAAARLRDAETELKEAQTSVEQNLLGISQTQRIQGNIIKLVVRPQEVVAAVQALSQAYYDYYGSVGDFNRAQFRLYRALGQPAQQLLNDTNCQGGNEQPAAAGAVAAPITLPNSRPSPSPQR